MMNDEMNDVLRGNTLCSDSPAHQRLRCLISKPMAVNGRNALKAEITAKAEQLVDRPVAKRRFCTAAELATALPVEIAASAVGLPGEGRERLLVWAEQMFNCFGPLTSGLAGPFPCFKK